MGLKFHLRRSRLLCQGPKHVFASQKYDTAKLNILVHYLATSKKIGNLTRHRN
jgi:hypothetical protein